MEKIWQEEEENQEIRIKKKKLDFDNYEYQDSKNPIKKPSNKLLVTQTQRLKRKRKQTKFNKPEVANTASHEPAMILKKNQLGQYVAYHHTSREPFIYHHNRDSKGKFAPLQTGEEAGNEVLRDEIMDSPQDKKCEDATKKDILAAAPVLEADEVQPPVVWPNLCFSCTECGATYREPSGLRKHMATKHTNLPAVSPASIPTPAKDLASKPPRTLIPCLVEGCLSTFTSKASMRRHLNNPGIHPEEKAGGREEVEGEVESRKVQKVLEGQEILKVLKIKVVQEVRESKKVQTGAASKELHEVVESKEVQKGVMAEKIQEVGHSKDLQVEKSKELQELVKDNEIWGEQGDQDVHKVRESIVKGIELKMNEEREEDDIDLEDVNDPDYVPGSRKLKRERSGDTWKKQTGKKHKSVPITVFKHEQENDPDQEQTSGSSSDSARLLDTRCRCKADWLTY